MVACKFRKVPDPALTVVAVTLPVSSAPTVPVVKIWVVFAPEPNVMLLEQLIVPELLMMVLQVRDPVLLTTSEPVVTGPDTRTPAEPEHAIDPLITQDPVMVAVSLHTNEGTLTEFVTVKVSACREAAAVMVGAVILLLALIY